MKPMSPERLALFPHGLSLATSNLPPAVIFKDEAEQEVLPVWVEPGQSRLLTGYMDRLGETSSCHRIAVQVMSCLGAQIEEVEISDLVGSTQFAQVRLRQGRKQFQFRARAGDVLALALQSRAKFFTSMEMIERCRRMHLEFLLQTYHSETEVH